MVLARTRRLLAISRQFRQLIAVGCFDCTSRQWLPCTACTCVSSCCSSCVCTCCTSRSLPVAALASPPVAVTGDASAAAGGDAAAATGRDEAAAAGGVQTHYLAGVMGLESRVPAMQLVLKCRVLFAVLLHDPFCPCLLSTFLHAFMHVTSKQQSRAGSCIAQCIPQPVVCMKSISKHANHFSMKSMSGSF